MLQYLSSLHQQRFQGSCLQPDFITPHGGPDVGIDVTIVMFTHRQHELDIGFGNLIEIHSVLILKNGKMINSCINDSVYSSLLYFSIRRLIWNLSWNLSWHLSRHHRMIDSIF